ncbi:MAG: alpha-amylase family glycosyl hydrolase, partial [Chloroflexota bacterium]|nr:alpha-amylase family glycosyl hydrolase [Chloroflexota bacterium]
MTDSDDRSSRPELDQRLLDRLLNENRARQLPRATYRLQFNPDFTFSDALAIVPYLASLGISHLYASPIFQAVTGSQHGYDVVDFGALNTELGTREEFDALCAELHAHDMELMLDFVPNHMGIVGGRNAWWQDVLENGQTSQYIDFFDIDWEPLKPELGNKVLLPILGEHYGVVLENGELELRYEDGGFTVWYYETPLPISPPSYSQILEPALASLAKSMEPDDPERMEFESIAAAFARLPGQDERDPELVAERRREQLVNRRRLASLTGNSPEIAEAISEQVRELNGAKDDPASFNALDDLLEAQSYRLAFWRVAAEEINYRRFFAINELAAIRQEVPEVFRATHALVMELVGSGAVSALRIDHPDGLWDPAGYFCNLQRAAFIARYLHAAGETESRDALSDTVRAWWDDRISAAPDDAGLRPLYVVVEKIVGHGEHIPENWQVDGTVGYEFAADVNGLLTDRRATGSFDRVWSGFTGLDISFADLA